MVVAMPISALSSTPEPVVTPEPLLRLRAKSAFSTASPLMLLEPPTMTKSARAAPVRAMSAVVANNNFLISIP